MDQSTLLIPKPLNNNKFISNKNNLNKIRTALLKKKIKNKTEKPALSTKNCACILAYNTSRQRDNKNQLDYIITCHKLLHCNKYVCNSS